MFTEKNITININGNNNTINLGGKPPFGYCVIILAAVFIVAVGTLVISYFYPELLPVIRKLVRLAIGG